MTVDMDTNIRASRNRVPRTRGATSGALLLLLGAWAALIPFIGPYLNLAYTPAANDAWYWTSGRGWLEVLPGAAVFLGGLLLLFSTSRVVTLFGGWLAAAGGAWLIVGPQLADLLNIDLGTPDPTSSTGVRALEALLFFYGIGAVILFLASVALGRLSVRSVRDVRAAGRRVAAEEAAAEEERRAIRDRETERARGQDRDEEFRNRGYAAPVGGEGATAAGPRAGYDEAGRHERTDETGAPTQVGPSAGSQPAQQMPGQPTYASAPPPEQRR